MLGQRGFTPILLILSVLVILGLVGGAYSIGTQKNSISQTNKSEVCTSEAKVCPDGSAVGRAGPNCAFTACPSAKPSSSSNTETTNWKTYNEKNGKYSIKYPDNLYLRETDISIYFLFEPYFEQADTVVDGITVSMGGDYYSSRFGAVFKANAGDDVEEAKSGVDVKVTKLKNFKVDGYDAVDYILDGTIPSTSGLGRGPIGYEHIVLIKRSSSEYIQLVNDSMNPESTKKHDEIFNAMLSSLILN